MMLGKSLIFHKKDLFFVIFFFEFSEQNSPFHFRVLPLPILLFLDPFAHLPFLSIPPSHYYAQKSLLPFGLPSSARKRGRNRFLTSFNLSSCVVKGGPRSLPSTYVHTDKKDTRHARRGWRRRKRERNKKLRPIHEVTGKEEEEEDVCTLV